MNLSAYKTEIITEGFFENTENTVKTLQQTQTKAQKTESLENKLSKGAESSIFVIPLKLENGELLLELTSLEG